MYEALNIREYVRTPPIISGRLLMECLLLARRNGCTCGTSNTSLVLPGGSSDPFIFSFPIGVYNSLTHLTVSHQI